MRSLLPIALALLVLPLGNALAAHNWLVALPLAAIVFGGLPLLVSPAAVAAPAPRSAATEAEQQGDGR